VSWRRAARNRIRRLLNGARLSDQAGSQKSKLRLLGLLILFDALLVVAVFLSFQSAELVEQVIELEQTREVYTTVVIEKIITHTTVITQVVPYGSVQ
jgi:hypothetical protein